MPKNAQINAMPKNAKLPHNCTHLTRGNREGNGNPLQYSCLENPMDRGAS